MCLFTALVQCSEMQALLIIPPQLWPAPVGQKGNSTVPSQDVLLLWLNPTHRGVREKSNWTVERGSKVGYPPSLPSTNYYVFPPDRLSYLIFHLKFICVSFVSPFHSICDCQFHSNFLICALHRGSVASLLCVCVCAFVSIHASQPDNDCNDVEGKLHKVLFILCHISQCVTFTVWSKIVLFHTVYCYECKRGAHMKQRALVERPQHLVSPPHWPNTPPVPVSHFFMNKLTIVFTWRTHLKYSEHWHRCRQF